MFPNKLPQSRKNVHLFRVFVPFLPFVPFIAPKGFISSNYTTHTRHNWSLQTFRQDYDLASHICCVRLILYMTGGTYSLKSTPNVRFFKETFHDNFIFSLRVFASNLLRGSRRRDIFHVFVLMSDLELESKHFLK